jgi:hypothetical protein
MEDLRKEIWNENGTLKSFECGLCRLERNKQIPACARAYSQYQLRQKSTRREVWVWVCQNHFDIVESRDSPYEILRRLF